MQKLIAFIMLLVVGVAPVFAGDQSPDDAYVACMIGNAAVNLHSRMDAEAAERAAGESCDPLYANVDDAEAEGISDFIHSLIADMAESSLFPQGN